MLKRRSPSIYLFLIFGYYGVVSFVSHIPGNTLEELNIVVWDKLAHVLLYFPLGLLVARLFGEGKITRRLGVRIGLGLLLFSAMACVDEFHQSYIPGRFASFGDVVADALGGLLGMGAWEVVRRMRGAAKL